jgi:hypothetical protein
MKVKDLDLEGKTLAETYRRAYIFMHSRPEWKKMDADNRKLLNPKLTHAQRVKIAEGAQERSHKIQSYEEFAVMHYTAIDLDRKYNFNANMWAAGGFGDADTWDLGDLEFSEFTKDE